MLKLSGTSVDVGEMGAGVGISGSDIRDEGVGGSKTTVGGVGQAGKRKAGILVGTLNTQSNIWVGMPVGVAVGVKTPVGVAVGVSQRPGRGVAVTVGGRVVVAVLVAAGVPVGVGVGGVV